MSSNLQFRGNNPGAVQYGNFINYYQFNPPENRLEVFPIEILEQIRTEGTRLFCLDIGCNAGDLTVKLQEFLGDKLQKEVFILGVDIDNMIIQRALDNNKTNAKIQFLTLDFMDEAKREEILQKYMFENNIRHFDITFCFSITMWIHLNHGDFGLKDFIYNVCKNSDLVVLEPQTWNNYQTAVRRLKRAGEEFPHFKTIKLKSKMESIIEEIFLNNQTTKVYESTRTKFKRKLFVFKSNK